MKSPRFGIRLTVEYALKTDLNRKVYRKIRDQIRHYRKLGIRKSVPEIIRRLHLSAFWDIRLKDQSDRSWEKNYYRAKRYHRCK